MCKHWPGHLKKKKKKNVEAQLQKLALVLIENSKNFYERNHSGSIAYVKTHVLEVMGHIL